MYPENEQIGQQGFDMNSDFLRDQEQSNIKQICQKYMNYHVVGQMKDGKKIEGILTGMDDQHVMLLVPEDVSESERESSDERYYGGGYGGYPRYRRFRPYRFPYFQFVFPFFYPYPYYYPYYPYPY
ncbi:hypothetical protein [Terrilactibacillus laevilacticus]|uniref:Uncharacterized protein n=1 Tax=Terrilactibacillus laevilacticus TaxID=1380157 RepID=A0ABW5PU31_9BACI|nr:hypothetical protein [Terrilactibacillus laevilacticus]